MKNIVKLLIHHLIVICTVHYRLFIIVHESSLPNICETIHKTLYCLLGNGRKVVLTIPEIVDELLHRNYPELIDFNGTKKLVIFVPEWYLTKAIKYVEPSRGQELLDYTGVQMKRDKVCFSL